MPHSLAYEADYLREKAERDLLNLLECVRAIPFPVLVVTLELTLWCCFSPVLLDLD